MLIIIIKMSSLFYALLAFSAFAPAVMINGRTKARICCVMSMIWNQGHGYTKEPLNKFRGSANQGWFARNQMRQHLIWRESVRTCAGLTTG